MAGLMYAGRHMAADMISTLLFALVYAATGQLALAIASGLVIGLGQLLWEVRAGRGVNAMQAISLFLVVAFGAASLIADDPRIAMLKPSVIYAAIGAAMLKPGWINRYMTERALELSGDVAFVFGFIWAGLMLLTASLTSYWPGRPMRRPGRLSWRSFRRGRRSSCLRSTISSSAQWRALVAIALPPCNPMSMREFGRAASARWTGNNLRKLLAIRQTGCLARLEHLGLDYG